MLWVYFFQITAFNLQQSTMFSQQLFICDNIGSDSFVKGDICLNNNYLNDYEDIQQL